MFGLKLYNCDNAGLNLLSLPMLFGAIPCYEYTQCSFQKVYQNGLYSPEYVFLRHVSK